jgi:hypothetical protein
VRTVVVAVALVALALPGTALARKPVIAHIDPTTNKLVFYDAELGTDVPAPDITVPGPVRRFAVSFDGRFVFYADAAKKLHLYDRASDSERPLPGIDVAAAPAGLSVSDTGRLAFDDNSNGPTVVYDSAAGHFLDAGFAADNGHRQSHLSGDGKSLATTCVTGAMHCVVDNNMVTTDSDLFVQNLTTGTDTAFPDNASGTPNVDEEHPCISWDGSLVGADAGPANNKDVFVYDRTAHQKLSLPGLNDAAKDDIKCVLSPGAGYIGAFDNGGNFKMYERSSQTVTPLPNVKTDPAWFSVPYEKPAPPDTVAPALADVSARPAHWRGRRGTTLSLTLTEAASVRVRIGRARAKFKPLRTIVRSFPVGPGKLHVPGTYVRAGRKRALRPGRYRIDLVATDAAGNASAPVAVRVRVLRRRKH